MSVHICSGVHQRFYGQVRLPGHRRWQKVAGARMSLARAIRDMARAFAAGTYKRGRVIMTADYYDPLVIVEMVRR